MTALSNVQRIADEWDENAPMDSFTLAPHNFNPTVLREYDIRGIIEETITPQDAFILGASYGTFLRERTKSSDSASLGVCVGYDGRLTSPALENALVAGLRRVGINVDRLGLGPTPMTYFAAMDHMSDGAIMVTGSHNPSEYNGFKMVLQGGAVFGDAIQEIGRIASEGSYFQTEKMGQERFMDVREAYTQRLIKDYEGGRALKVVWDAGNGAAGEVLRNLVSKLPGEHILLYDKIDGTFPNHHPDPTVDKNLVELQRVVIEQGADLGIAFDGDGDRIGAVDNKAQILRCDTLLQIYAREILQEFPGAPIIGDVKCSQSFFDKIKEMGGNAVMARTGHSLVKTKMAEMKAPLAGELSGHIFFADKYYGFDDALYCGIRLMNELTNSDTPLSDILDSLPAQVSTPEIRIEVDEEKKFGMIDKLVASAKQDSEAQDDVTVIDIDGIRYQSAKGWWLARASNTQNCLVARAEASNKEDLEAVKAQLEHYLKTIGLSLEQAIK